MSENDKTADLKPILQNLGFSDVLFDTGARTKKGTLLKPDLQFHLEGKYYVLEAKTEPSSYSDAIQKASKDLAELMEPVEIAFAVLWLSKGKMRAGYISNDGQTGQKVFASIQELANWIMTSCTAKKVSPLLNESGLLKVLNDLVERFYQHYKKVSMQDIQELFGGKSFFETVLSESGGKEQEVQSLRKVAAFLLVNQIFFYGILAKKTKKYPDLNPEKAQKPYYLQQLFEKVLEDDYAPVFGVPVLNLSDDKTIGADLRYCATTINKLLEHELSHDILGKVFHNLIPLKLRKIVAAYYTNSHAGDLLASLAIEDATDTVFDPACGSGTLLISSYRKKKELFAKEKTFDDTAHKKFLTRDIFGSDIMPFAGHLAAINLILQKPETFLNSLNVLIEDSTGLMPGHKVEPAEEKLTQAFKQPLLHEFDGGTTAKSKKILKGAVGLKKKRGAPVTLKKFDVVIMNPPFTRFQRLTPEYKATLEQNLSEPTYKKMIHGQLGLQGYFMLLADRFLKEGGRIAAVLPVTVFTGKGGSDIIKFFFANYKIEYMIIGTGRAAFSENTSIREVLFVARKAKPIKAEANVCFISQSPTDMDSASVNNITEKLKSINTSKRCIDDVDVFSERISQEEVIKNPRFLATFLNLPLKELQKANSLFENNAKRSGKFSKGKELFEQLEWGVFESKRITGKEGYYELSILPSDAAVAKEHDLWKIESVAKDSLIVINRRTENKIRIPKSAVMPQFRRFSGQKTFSLDPPKQFVVFNTFSDLNKFLENTGIPSSSAKELTKRLVDLEFRKYLHSGAGTSFLFYRGNLSAPNTVILFAASNQLTFGAGDSWVMRIDTDFVPLMAIYFNSTFFILQLLKERRETEGAMLSIDKHALEEIWILDPRKLKTEESKMVHNLWEEIKSSELPSLTAQLQDHSPTRTKIDLVIAELLDIPKNQRTDIVHGLQTALARYINILKSTMSGK